MPKYYSGIGSRKTPDDILLLMEKIGTLFANKGWVLNSGGAIGADSAFEKGCDLVSGQKNIFRPYHATDAAREIVRQYLEPGHYDILVKKGYLDLHARNCFQVFGADLQTPVRGVICWTPDGATTLKECGKKTGGTGTAIKLAQSINIPICNLQIKSHLEKALSWFE